MDSAMCQWVLKQQLNEYLLRNEPNVRRPSSFFKKRRPQQNADESGNLHPILTSQVEEPVIKLFRKFQAKILHQFALRTFRVKRLPRKRESRILADEEIDSLQQKPGAFCFWPSLQPAKPFQFSPQLFVKFNVQYNWALFGARWHKPSRFPTRLSWRIRRR